LALGGDFRIYVDTIDMGRITFRMNSSDSIDLLKIKMWVATGVPPWECVLRLVDVMCWKELLPTVTFHPNPQFPCFIEDEELCCLAVEGGGGAGNEAAGTERRRTYKRSRKRVE
jgi:hypothetical protein